MPGRVRLGGGAAVAVAGAALALLVPAAAAAASDSAEASPQVLVSENGVEFGESIPGALFTDIGALVPGDVVTDSVWFLNPTDAPATLRVSARNSQVSSEVWANDAEFEIWNSGTRTAESLTIGDLRGCAVLVPMQTVPAGEAIEIALELSIGDWPADAGQNGSARFELLASMRDAEAGPFAASACEDDGVIVDVGDGAPGADGAGAGTVADADAAGGRLAWTGPTGTGLIAVVAGTLVGLGALVISARRRRDVTG